MGTYFLDTSAIVKRYVAEQGQSLLLDLCSPEQGNPNNYPQERSSESKTDER